MRAPIIKNAGKKVKMRDFSRNAGLNGHPGISINIFFNYQFDGDSAVECGMDLN